MPYSSELAAELDFVKALAVEAAAPACNDAGRSRLTKRRTLAT